MTLSDVVTIPFSEKDVAYVRHMARLRNGGPGNDGKPDKSSAFKVRNQTSEENHVLGLFAEVAVSRYLDAPFDESIYFGGDGGKPDIVLKNIKIEVRATKFYPPILKFNDLVTSQANVYILCRVGPLDSLRSFVEIWGCVSKKRFLKEHTQQDFGYGSRFVMQAEQLSPMTAMKEYLEVS